jgi:hypothetical protein
MPHVRSMYYLRSESYQTKINQIGNLWCGRTVTIRFLCSSCVFYVFVRAQIKKLKYSFDQRSELITVEYHNKNKGFNAFIDERRVCGEDWKGVY